jgi:hypothetical protein
MRDRGQLWAEAAHLEATGMSITLAEELWPVATKEQQARMVIDPVEERIEDLVGDRTGTLPMEEIYRAIGLGSERTTQRTSKTDATIRRVMTKLGWEWTRIRSPRALLGGRGDNRVRVWQRGDSSQWWIFGGNEFVSPTGDAEVEATVARAFGTLA